MTTLEKGLYHLGNDDNTSGIKDLKTQIMQWTGLSSESVDALANKVRSNKDN